MIDKLSTVHDAVRESILDNRGEEELKPATYKIQPDLKDKTVAILSENGTTLSAFLRWCCTLLVQDYNPPKPKKNIDPEEGSLPVGYRGE